MPKYNLTPPQRAILRDLVRIAQDTGEYNFCFTGTFQFMGVYFETTPQQSVKLALEDLQLFAEEGLITLRSRTQGQIRQSAIDAVEADFERPAPHPPSIGSAGNVFLGNVDRSHIQGASGHYVTQQLTVTDGSAAELAQLSALVAELIGGIRAALPPHLAEEAEADGRGIVEELGKDQPDADRVAHKTASLWEKVGATIGTGAGLVKNAGDVASAAEKLRALVPAARAFLAAKLHLPGH